MNTQGYALMNAGAFNLEWLLEPGEPEENVKSTIHITDEEVQEFVLSAQNGVIEPLYLVKWR